MADDILKGYTHTQLLEIIDDLAEQQDTIRKAFQNYPALPNPRALLLLERMAGQYPSDHERGKEMQRELGCGLIPAKNECEGGAGFWDRITNGAWRDTKKEGQSDG